LRHWRKKQVGHFFLAMNERGKQKLELLRHRFLEWLEAGGYSPKTRVNYGRDVREFIDWIAGETELSAIGEVSSAHLQQYQLVLFQREQEGKEEEPRRLSLGAQVNKLAAVRKFFGWLLGEGMLAHNPASALELPKRPRSLPRTVLTPQEARRLIEATPVKKPKDIRDRALIEVLYATGIRRAELIGLKMYDLDLNAATLKVSHGKGNTVRIVPLTSSAIAALKLYLEESRPVYARQGIQTALFVSSRSGGPLDADDIVRIVRKAARRAKIAKHITPHTLRHSVATHLLAGQADIRQIQKLLGHRRLTSTEIYTRVEIGDLQEVIARCHPREKKVKGDE
jgi:integrase/recombinase XerD